MASLTDIANIAEVSRATASLVLNRSKGWERISPGCRQRVRAVAERLGYRTNYHMQAIRRGRANIIGFVVEVGRLPGTDDWRIGYDWWHALSGGAESATHEREFEVLTFRPDKAHSAIERAAIAVRQGKIDAIVVPDPVARDMAADLPIVAISADMTLPSAVVAFDESAGVRLALEHLGHLGHRGVLWYGLEGDRSGGASPRERSFISAARDLSMRGQSLRAGPLVAGTEFDAPDRHLEHLERQAARFLKSRPRDFSAVVAYNDYYAAAMCRALMRRGIGIPGEVSVVGFDNLIAVLAFPPLTTVDYQLHDVGYRAGQLAMDLAMDKAGHGRINQLKEIIPPRLVVRESSDVAREA